MLPDTASISLLRVPLYSSSGRAGPIRAQLLPFVYMMGSASLEISSWKARKLGFAKPGRSTTMLSRSGRRSCTDHGRQCLGGFI